MEIIYAYDLLFLWVCSMTSQSNGYGCGSVLSAPTLNTVYLMIEHLAFNIFF